MDDEGMEARSALARAGTGACPYDARVFVVTP
jgi:hypothetical protein